MIEVTFYQLKHTSGTKFYNVMRVNGPGVDATVFNFGGIGRAGQFQTVSRLGAVAADKKISEKRKRGYEHVLPGPLSIQHETVAEITHASRSRVTRSASPGLANCWDVLPDHIKETLGGTPRADHEPDLGAEAAEEYEHGFDTPPESSDTTLGVREGTERPKPPAPKPNATKSNPNYGMFA